MTSEKPPAADSQVLGPTYIRGLPAVKQAQAPTLAAEFLEPFRTDAGHLVPGETLNVLADMALRA